MKPMMRKTEKKASSMILIVALRLSLKVVNVIPKGAGFVVMAPCASTTPEYCNIDDDDITRTTMCGQHSMFFFSIVFVVVVMKMVINGMEVLGNGYGMGSSINT